MTTAQGAAPVELEARRDGKISRRLDALEADRARMTSAAAAALAAAALVGSLPDLPALRRGGEGRGRRRPEPRPAVPAPPIAQRGAPSRAALATSFPDYAARAASAARAPGEEAGVLARSATPCRGSWPCAGWARCRGTASTRSWPAPKPAGRGRRPGRGPAPPSNPCRPPPESALGPWRERAERRAKIDRQHRRGSAPRRWRISPAWPGGSEAANDPRGASSSCWWRPSATAILAITGDPGHASVVWLGWRADMTAAAFVLITLFIALSAMLAWRLLLWAAEALRRAEHARGRDHAGARPTTCWSAASWPRPPATAPRRGGWRRRPPTSSTRRLAWSGPGRPGGGGGGRRDRGACGLHRHAQPAGHAPGRSQGPDAARPEPGRPRRRRSPTPSRPMPRPAPPAGPGAPCWRPGCEDGDWDGARELAKTRAGPQDRLAHRRRPRRAALLAASAAQLEARARSEGPRAQAQEFAVEARRSCSPASPLAW